MIPDGTRTNCAQASGLSIAVVPLPGRALNYTPFGIRLVPILVVLSVFTVLFAVIVDVWRQPSPDGGAVCGWGGGRVLSEDF